MAIREIGHMKITTPSPQSRQREAGDVWCSTPVWNLRAVIWFPFPISSYVFFCLVLLLCLVIFLLISLMVHSPDFFPQKLKYFSLRIRVRLFCMALVEQLGDDSWSVVCAACWYLPLCMYIYITFLNFILCLSIPFFYFSLTWYR